MAHYGPKKYIHDTRTDNGQFVLCPKELLLLLHVGTVPLVEQEYRWAVETFISQDHVLSDGPEAVEQLRLQPCLHD